MEDQAIAPLRFRKPEAAKMLGISVRTLEKLIHQKKIAVVPILGTTGIDRQELQAFIERNRTTLSSEGK